VQRQAAAEGRQAAAEGPLAAAEGPRAAAEGPRAAAEGLGAAAEGLGAAAEGLGAAAEGPLAAAEGRWAAAEGADHRLVEAAEEVAEVASWLVAEGQGVARRNQECSGSFRSAGRRSSSPNASSPTAMSRAPGQSVHPHLDPKSTCHPSSNRHQPSRQPHASDPSRCLEKAVAAVEVASRQRPPSEALLLAEPLAELLLEPPLLEPPLLEPPLLEPPLLELPLESALMLEVPC
jgi:hypothetical protein